MTPDTAAARLSIALRPGASIAGPAGNERAFAALDRFAQFARDVRVEAGPAVLAEIVHTVEQHQQITRGAA